MVALKYRIASSAKDLPGPSRQPGVMASAAIELDWPKAVRAVCGLFPKWDPRYHWIRRQHDSNLECKVCAVVGGPLRSGMMNLMLSSVSLVTGANDSTRLSIPDLNIWRYDGRLIISGSDDCTTRISNAKTGAAVSRPLKWHTGWVLSVAYSPDGWHIIFRSLDRTIRI